ncbi:unnamed protein product [Paramecium primaurelia]|uniref:Transmembrane protein n=1 Tax=Paramecium primaurelia TaxID=5886 RepID=A0A8S1MZ11_PARPR|nr:unnamed protein product [Paramecium primaurelia]
MQEIQQKRDIYNEGWSPRELEDKQKFSTKITLIALILAITLIIVAITFFNKYSLTIMMLLLFSGIVSIVLSGVIMYWFNISQITQESEVELQKRKFEVDSRISAIVFLGSFINILYNIILLVFLVFWYRIGQDYYQANHSVDTSITYMNDYKIGVILGFPILILISLILMYVAFTSYITVPQKSQLRVCIYVFALSTILIASLALNQANQASADLSTPYSPILISSAFSLFKTLSIISLITALFAFIITFIYRNSLFETIGYANLILIFLITACSFYIIRQSEQMRSAYINQCGQEMRNTHQDWIKENASCNKYQEQNTCDPQYQSIFWEKDSSQQCLNVSCCKAFSDSMSKNIFYTGFFSLLLVISGFALSTALLQVDTTLKGMQIPNRKEDWTFVLIGLVVLVFSLLLIFGSVTQPNQKDIIIVANQQVIQANKNPLVYPTGIENVTGCESFMEVYKKQNNNKELVLNEDSRLTILAPQMQLVVTEYVNSPKVSYIPKEMIKNVFYNQAGKNDGIFGVEGDKGEIKKILSNHIQICSEGDKKQLTIDTFALQSSRLLWQKHKVHAAEDKSFNQEAKQYISKNLKFTNLQINIIDIQSGLELDDVILYFYKNEDDCGKIKPIPQRIITVNQNSVLYNMVVRDYYFGAEKKGYYLYCNKFTNQENTKILEVTMIPRNTKKGQLTVTLEVPKQNKFNVLLGAAYPECVVGFFNENCGGMQFYGSKTAQSIQINQLANRKYTFFVQFDPIDGKLKELNNKKSEGLKIDSSIIDNDPIFKEIKPVVTLYGYEQERPIIRYTLPQISNLKKEPNLTWLVLCVDGGIGDISQKSCGQFWKYSENPNKFERAENSKEIYPQVCNKL